ncbi:hypothetical protein JL857_23900 [Vibrio parahaemolyticus]|uniref:hypothetical protein n=1 Tax=Vibrio parahaemolyticus TaxID=670 RepID=UPI001B81E72B|nr:hypothetical protein [Vibrio parahaemolyticus]MCI9697077.1 hypothetical protein [Vibrio parahaemolyticus]MCI9711686.1 hypothetical protein [Vibrio parahaemolyticus]MCI9716551.1 hypothetical protein [Vibrio parahaemolyticus]MCR9947586.1 hypothetical protein [Vibrio parahaemolyticus]MCR9995335.1 hypothetical protein [Vibrio parahaemolyticus]
MDEDIRLSAQRALLGCISRGLRAVSIERAGKVIKWRCIFASEVAKESQWEILSEAATEVIADFDSSMQIEEEYIVVRFRDAEDEPPNEMLHLRHVAFLRHERDGYSELASNT